MATTTKTDAKAPVQDVQEQILDTAQKGQEAVVDAVKAWADAVKAIIPPLPVTPELAARLPKPEEIVANAYDFAEQLLATQRQYAEKLLAAAAPVLPRA